MGHRRRRSHRVTWRHRVAVLFLLGAFVAVAQIGAVGTASLAQPRPILPTVVAPSASPTVAVTPLPTSTSTPNVLDVPRLDAACDTLAPYYAVAQFPGDVTDDGRSPAAAVVAFAAPPDGGSAPYTHTVATAGQVGAVYGLAYDAPRHHLYAAAYFRRMAWYGPGGPGQIYRINLASGAVEAWAQIPAGSDEHSGERDLDTDAARRVGKSSLADIELDDSGSTLFASNMHDAHILRIAVPNGTVLGSFPFGAMDESWAVKGRPFGLGFRGGWLYHGVVDPTGSSLGIDGPVGHVYRSRPDGSEMRDVAQFALEPDTGTWLPDGAALSDIEFNKSGDLVVGLRNRVVDTSLQWSGRVGDLLPSVPDGQGWRVITAPEHYRDQRSDIGSLTMGGLAAVLGLDRVVTTAIEPGGGYVGGDGGGVFDPDRASTWWFDNPSGEPLTMVGLGSHRFPLYTQGPTVGLGDLEVLCARDGLPDPSLAPTATEEIRRHQTATATPPLPPPTRPPGHGGQTPPSAPTLTALATARSDTATAIASRAAGTATGMAATAAAATSTPADVPPEVAATLTAVAGTLTAQVPTRDIWATSAAGTATASVPANPAFTNRYAQIVAACDTDNPYVAGAHILPALDARLRAIAQYLIARERAVFAIQDTPWTIGVSDMLPLARQGEVGTTYGLAWDWRRGHLYASAYNSRATYFGPAGTGGIYRLDLTSGATVPWSWLDAGTDTHDLKKDYDAPGAAGVGLQALGDLEIAEDGSTLYAVNLFDRLIYRLSLPDGRVLGAFPHGAAGAEWAEDARPFGLGFRGGWLYNGVVDSRASRGSTAGPVYIYRSHPDGSSMEEVARFDLDYPSAPPWAPWRTTFSSGVQGPMGVMVSDIVFRPSGDMFVGLRDRLVDGSVLQQSVGDILPGLKFGDRFVAVTEPDHFNAPYFRPWGGLASMPRSDVTVSTSMSSLTWLDNVTGEALGEQRFALGFRKNSMLGDVEVLCPPDVPPPTPTVTSTATSTATPSPTATHTVTPSATPTPVPGRLYLPVSLRRACTPEDMFADVVLVIDVSTSMRRATSDGPEKLAAVQSAAKSFIDQMDFSPDGRDRRDQVALVGFNQRAWIEQPLTSDASALRAAVEHIRDGMKQGTRLDLAVEWGVRALDDPARQSENTPVIVLMTDGLPNGVPLGPGGSQEETVVARAAGAKVRGIRIYAIGVGLPEGSDVADRINMDLLRAVASEPQMAFQTFSARELARIYDEIAYSLGCPGGAYWAAGP